MKGQYIITRKTDKGTVEHYTGNPRLLFHARNAKVFFTKGKAKNVIKKKRLDGAYVERI